MTARALLAAAAMALIATTLAAPASTATSVPTASTGAWKAKFCHGHRATIVGNHQFNILIGTPHRDVIWAGGGMDVVLGRGGDDLICGGRGSDQLDGQRGLDPTYGGPGQDQCYGQMREHRHLHHGCEVHPPEPPKLKPGPPPPPSKAAVQTKATKESAHSKSGSFYFAYDNPVCDPNTKTIDFKNFYFTAEYTDPGTFAVIPYFAYFKPGGWDGPYWGDWVVVNAPNDGQTYQSTVGTFTGRGALVVGYQWGWWDGAAWANAGNIEPIGQVIGNGHYQQQYPFGPGNYLGNKICALGY